MTAGAPGTGGVRALGAGRLPRTYRLTVRDTPERSVDRAVDALLAQGFVLSPSDLTTALVVRAPAWTTRVVQIGDDAATWRRGALAAVAGLVSGGLLGDLVPRAIEATWVVVTAQPSGDGSCTLVLAPLAARAGQTGGGGSTARAPLDAAAEAIVRERMQDGTLAAPPTSALFAADPGCPGIPRTFRAALKDVRARR